MRRMLKGSKYANVTSTMALVVALGGTGAYAANTIGSSDIKNNSIRSADIKNKEVKNTDLANNSVTSGKVKNGTLLSGDFKAGQLPAGAKGANGANGANGAPGAPGAKGDIGPSNAYSDRSGIVAFGAAAVTVASVSLPAGAYAITAETVMNNNSGAQADVECALNLGATLIDRNHAGDGFGIPLAATGGLDRQNTTLTGSGTLAAAGTATLVCNAGGVAGNYVDATITAIKVATAEAT